MAAKKGAAQKISKKGCPLRRQPWDFVGMCGICVLVASVYAIFWYYAAIVGGELEPITLVEAARFPWIFDDEVFRPAIF